MFLIDSDVCLQEVQPKEDGFGGSISNGAIFPCEDEDETLHQDRSLANTLIIRQADDDIWSLVDKYLIQSNNLKGFLILGSAGARKVRIKSLQCHLYVQMLSIII